VVGNYLKGQTPPPFDLLYWNSDSHQPARPLLRVVPAQHSTSKTSSCPAWCKAVTVCGEKLDLRMSSTLPVYIYGSREDHIVPAAGGLRLHAGAAGQEALRDGRFGPHRRRDQPAGQEASAAYWIRADGKLPASAWMQWLARARTEHAWLLVDRTGANWLKGAGGQADCRAQRLRQGRKVQSHRTGSGPLCQAKGLIRNRRWGGVIRGAASGMRHLQRPTSADSGHPGVRCLNSSMLHPSRLRSRTYVRRCENHTS
jgi:polyhydroxyalkanoate synthase subunit PhaC